MASEQHTSPKILQVFPAATGWGAVYTLENEDIITGPLVCWALVEEVGTGSTSVIGMIAENDKVEFAPSENFLGYSYPNCTTDWKELAQLKQNQ